MPRRSDDPEAVQLKDREALAAMRRAGALVGATLALLRAHALPGVTTADLNALAQRYITDRGGVPSFLGYPNPDGVPFSGAICTSVNDVIVHGIPGEQLLREGDIVSLDVGAILDGWHGDAAITVPVGAVSETAQRLIGDTEAALAAAIQVARAGNRLADISSAIERAARRGGYGVVVELTGHGIGRQMHEAPTVPNRPDRRAGSGLLLRPGMTFTIEPIFTTGSGEIVWHPDGWTVTTADGSLAVHVEHTIAVTAQGPPEILTGAG